VKLVMAGAVGFTLAKASQKLDMPLITGT
jgi:hypothetical protein